MGCIGIMGRIKKKFLLLFSAIFIAMEAALEAMVKNARV